MIRSSMSRAAVFMAVLAAPVLAMPAVVFAQSATPSAASSAQGPGQNVDAHIQVLHEQLQITPAEEPQWASFAQVMRGNATQMEQALQARGTNLENMNAAQDMQSYAQLAQLQSGNMQRLAASFQTLYASFPPAQQKVADGVFRAKIAQHTKP
jgi:protein CpxP